ncbi:MAG: sulfite exporter TauE/SafE family protein [Kangiellaceae bacterium]|jgi:uncharacterized membrane protein YfcA|nr:sulfite exporter TauE/SafE family protein [Kangiellaceae bacterium]
MLALSNIQHLRTFTLIIGYLAAAFMGLVLGVIGGGGSILTVPILVYLMGVNAETATGYSLLIVGATAAFGTIRYFRQGLVDLRSSLIFAIPSIISVYFSRAVLMPAIPSTFDILGLTLNKSFTIMVLFALLMLAAASMMLIKAHPSNISELKNDQKSEKELNLPLVIIDGAVVGLLTGILGAGGGFLIIPALVLIMKMPMKEAVGSSLFIIALKSLIGFSGDLRAGIELDIYLLTFTLLATFVGMASSKFLTGKIENHTLQRLFAYFTFIIAFVIVTKEIL